MILSAIFSPILPIGVNIFIKVICYSYKLYNSYIHKLTIIYVTCPHCYQTKKTRRNSMQASPITELPPQPSLASTAASTCQFMVARTRPTLVLLTDIEVATQAAVLSFCASITCACRCALIADPRFAVRGGGLANTTLEELHPVCSCDHQVHVTIAIPIYEARHDTKRTKGNLNGQV